ncbi:tyrosine-type recombinase/integrase [Planctomycetota bacterium]
MSEDLPKLIQGFFCRRLIRQQNASSRTVASYRDSFRLLLRFAEERVKKSPAALTVQDLDAPLVLAFLDHLEQERGNSVRSRNLRLTAIRSFMRYVSLQVPTQLPTVQRVLAIPTKRFDRPLLGFLSREEMEAVIAAPNESTWSGRRDRAMFAMLYNTGARVSEVIGLRLLDLPFDREASVHLRGKGRKQRVVPLWKSTVKQLRCWIDELAGTPESPVFPNRWGKPMSRSGVEQRLRVAVSKAAKNCSTLGNRRVSPHTVRHTTAMHLLQAGVDITVIALWLGHESPSTTHLYVEADLAMKERALQKLQDPSVKTTRYQPTDSVLAFLDSL